MKKFILLFALFIVAGLLAACSSAPPPAEFTVEMTEFAYTPNTIEVQVGQEVIIHMTNQGALSHEFMIGRNMMMMDGAPSTFETNMFEKQGPVMSGGSNEHDMSSMDDPDHGFMVAISSGGEDTTMTFTATEEMVGEWEIGCFTDGGSHYLQGMTGKFIVNP
ncbi:MAG: hypothetical protein Fur0022_00970 [Anaerolineales bacterium]